MSEFLAAILVRGTINVRHDILAALTTLKLLRKHVCVVVKDTTVHRGMMRKCKDYIAWGPINKETYAALEKRGSLKDKKGEPTNVFRLQPPRGGFKGSTKKAYQAGGVLGLREEQMDELVMRMV